MKENFISQNFISFLKYIYDMLFICINQNRVCKTWKQYEEAPKRCVSGIRKIISK